MKNSTPCGHCRARIYDPGRFHAIYGLCVYCFPLADARQLAADRWRCRQVDRRPVDRPTEAGPGTEAKIERLAFRLEHGLRLHHPDDKQYDRHIAEVSSLVGEQWRELDFPEDDPEDWKPGRSAFRPDSHNLHIPACLPVPLIRRDRSHHRVIRPTVDPLPVGSYHRWIELDTSRGRTRYRVRPRLRGCKVNLGTYDHHERAVAAARDFEADTSTGQLASESTSRQPTAAAVVRVPDGWHIIDWPTDCSRPVARLAARRLAAGYDSREAADRAYRRLLRAAKWVTR